MYKFKRKDKNSLKSSITDTKLKKYKEKLSMDVYMPSILKILQYLES